MPLQPRRNNSDDVESLAPIDLLQVKGPQTIYPYFTQQQNSILHYWQILRKRKWAALATFAIVFALSVIATLNATRVYQATSKVAIFPENPNVLGFKDNENNGFPDFDSEATLETLGLDSLSVLELMFKIEDRYKVKITDDTPTDLLTVSDVVRYIDGLLAANSATHSRPLEASSDT